LTAASLLLIVAAQPAGALEIGSASVMSRQGEPLDATVRIFPGPGERIEAGCLSIARSYTHPDPGVVLLTQAKLSLLRESGSIRFTTTEPVTHRAVAIALQSRCAGSAVNIRTIEVYLPAAIAPHVVLDSTLPGTTVTVQAGDSIFRLARLIYPHNERAVHDLAEAIVLANPALFPQARARGLRIGERLTIPDLRTVQQVIAAASQPQNRPAYTTGAGQTDLKKTGLDQAAPARARAIKPAAPGVSQAAKKAAAVEEPERARQSTEAAHYRIVTAGELRLKLATRLDPGQRGVIAQSQRQTTPSQPAPVSAKQADALAAPQLPRISARIDRIRELQDSINARLARLEINATVLMKTLAHNQALQQASPPAPGSTAGVASPHPQDSAQGLIARAKPLLQQWQWLAVAGSLLVLLVSYLLARFILRYRHLGKHRKRIDAMLEEARSAATPLLGHEPALHAQDAYRPASGGDPDFVSARTYDSEVSADSDLDLRAVEPDESDPSVAQDGETWLDPGSSQMDFDAQSEVDEEMPVRLRQEMDEAMNTARSMYSDVDRFIMLGRIENAVSLLEFQIKRDPMDRNSWIKLLAVYRDQGLDASFDRTYAAFRDQFGSDVGA
jgi:hypothetical protein